MVNAEQVAHSVPMCWAAPIKASTSVQVVAAAANRHAAGSAAFNFE